MSQFVCYNGQLHPATSPLLAVQNRSFKYGDGVFETMKLIGGDIPLFPLHMNRLFSSLKMLGIKSTNFTRDSLNRSITTLAETNNCLSLARIRLAIFRNDANEAGYVIEASWLGDEANRLNEEGLAIDIFPHCRKSCDAFANLKSANFLPYVLAGREAINKVVDDCIVLNSENNVCDTSKANVFFFREGELFTPALNQGCVNGVMRKFLIANAKQQELSVHQSPVSEEDLVTADEVFLTNAVYGIRWVKSFRQREYGNERIKSFSKILKESGQFYT